MIHYASEAEAPDPCLLPDTYAWPESDWLCEEGDDCEAFATLFWEEPDDRFSSGFQTRASCKAHRPKEGMAPRSTHVARLWGALESGQCPHWIHDAAHTQDIEALRKIALWYARWNNKVRLPAMAAVTGAEA